MDAPSGTQYDDLGALLGKGNGGGAPDAGQSASDQDDWVGHFPVPHDFEPPADGAWMPTPGERRTPRVSVRGSPL
jgi:hypothetical protein